MSDQQISPLESAKTPGKNVNLPLRQTHSQLEANSVLVLLPGGENKLINLEAKTDLVIEQQVKVNKFHIIQKLIIGENQMIRTDHNSFTKENKSGEKS